MREDNARINKLQRPEGFDKSPDPGSGTFTVGMFRRGKWVIRSIGWARAQHWVVMANLVYAVDRFTFLIRETG